MSDDSLQQERACFITMSNIRTDARTLNVIDYLKDKLRLVVIGFGTVEDVIWFASNGVKFILIEEPKKLPARKTWKYFNKKIDEIGLIKCDYVWASDFFSLKSAKKISKINKAELIYDCREIYSKIPSLRNYKFKQWIQTTLEKYWVKSVNKIVVTGELDKQYLEKHFRSTGNYYIIMNLPYYKKVENKNLIRKEYNLDNNSRILVYQGMLSEGRGLEKAIVALRDLPNYYLLLLGSGKILYHLQEMSRLNGVRDKVIFKGIVPYRDLLNWTASADIGLNVIEDVSFSYKLALPNKLFEYCMSGVPVISSRLPAIEKIYEEFKIGELIDTDCSPEKLSEIIRTMEDKEKLNFYKTECFKAADKYNYQNQFKIIDEIFELN